MRKLYVRFLLDSLQNNLQSQFTEAISYSEIKWQSLREKSVLKCYPERNWFHIWHEILFMNLVIIMFDNLLWFL